VKALVLGGTRFIGRRLVEELLSAGHKVSIYTRGLAPDPFGGRVERFVGDRKSRAALDAALSGRDFDAAYDFLSYDADDALLALGALEGRVGHFIHLSTCSVYWCTGCFPCPVTEEEFAGPAEIPRRPGSIEYAYGLGKRHAEATLFEAHKQRGLPLTAIRLPIVGGEGDRSLRYASYCLRVADGAPLILPDGGFAPLRQVYVGDVAAMLARLPQIPRAIGQAYNLACAEILSVRAIVMAIAQVMGRTLETVDISTPVLDRLGLGTAFSPFSQRAPQVPAIFKARQELGWVPTPYASWLERAVAWALDEKSRGGETPEGYAHRARELEAIERYQSSTSMPNMPSMPR